MTKIFVGTLYSQEGEFDACVKCIHEQVGIEVTHFIVAGYDEKAAHNVLWDEWNAQKHCHDLFVKVDADTLLRENDTLERIARLFEADKRITGMQAPLYDYMTDGPIYGLSAFSPAVIFRRSNDGLFCDHGVDTGHDLVLREQDLPPELCPAGTHCVMSTDRQAFHFGLHRALKNQGKIIMKVYVAWAQHRDRPRAFVLAGADAACQFTHRLGGFNYNDPEFIAAFDTAKKRIGA